MAKIWVRRSNYLGFRRERDRERVEAALGPEWRLGPESKRRSPVGDVAVVDVVEVEGRESGKTKV